MCKFLILFFVFYFPLFTFPQESISYTDAQQVNSLLWVRKSAEYYFSISGIYASAQRYLAERTQVPGYRAGRNSPQKKPYAVIIDIDETVLDNSEYQAWLVTNGLPYSATSWKTWVLSANSKEIPGAKSFIAFANSRNVRVFYISNRTCTIGCIEKNKTIENMRNLGFSVPPNLSFFLFRGENGWGDDKSSRRELVYSKYNVLMTIGDDLKDFLPAKYVDENRNNISRLIFENSSHFGIDWYLLPNPMYGSWERFLPQDFDARMQILSNDLTFVGH